MTDISLLSAFLIGLAGSVHCVGMCGGIVGTLTFTIPKTAPTLPFHLAYNLGRISSYALAGLIAGGLGSIISLQLHSGLAWLQMLSAVFLIMLGLYIGDWWRGLVYLEKQGQKLWRVIQPLSKKLIPLRSPLYALPYGMIWGWLPCGLVYSTLTWSLAAGSAPQGALIMLFFGIGTLPALLALGSASNQIRQKLATNLVRKSISAVLILFGIVLVYQSVPGIM